MARLAGKVALITGAGTGIGRATALLFAREGAKVVVAELDTTSGEETAHLAGNGAIAVATDVREPDSIERAIRTAVDQFGALHVLHNNAGGSTADDNTASRRRSMNSGAPSRSISTARFSAAASGSRRSPNRAAVRSST